MYSAMSRLFANSTTTTGNNQRMKRRSLPSSLFVVMVVVLLNLWILLFCGSNSASAALALPLPAEQQQQHDEQVVTFVLSPTTQPPPAEQYLSSSAHTPTKKHHTPEQQQQRRSSFLKGKITKPSSLLFLPKKKFKPTSSSSSSHWKVKKQKRRAGPVRQKRRIISNVQELRRLVLDEKLPLKETKVDNTSTFANMTVSELLNHDVLQLMKTRFLNGSKPGERGTDDQNILALALEGGGMRGAVSAGMAAAIASLGLTDTIDRIYGSSAGSVIGAYMVSRQMCMDVYVDILPAAKKTFVCTKRMFSALAVTALDWLLKLVVPISNLPRLSATINPGMNISFVLDGIMHEDHGIRPLDVERFRVNDRIQPLRVASSYVKNHKLYTKCFGTEHFFPHDSMPGNVIQRADGQRQGLYACLEASMTVPGATGPPVPIVEDGAGGETTSFFDAFCFEPLPYRSAVAEGATHVLVLCSRPEGFQPKTTPGVYERGVAPLYFRSHGEPAVADFFERGGQQYIYAEDLLTLEEGKREGIKVGGEGISVPPPEILYGVQRDERTERLAQDRNSWNKAHLLPLKVPIGTPELPTLQQEREEVSNAVRGGFAAAFDLLAPVVGLELSEGLTGAEVAKMVFPPDSEHDEFFVLQNQLRVIGDEIRGGAVADTPPEKIRRRKRDILRRLIRLRRRQRETAHENSNGTPLGTSLPSFDSLEGPEKLLSLLPGFSSGQMAHLASALHNRQTSRNASQ